MRPHKIDHRIPHQRKMITANTLLITSKAGTWKLLINYFKQHYGNERTAAGNLERPSLLDGMEDDVLCAEHCDKSHTNSDEEGEQIQQMFSE